MKAIIRDVYGSPDVLRLAEVDKPVVGDEGVLVRVRAASLNADDLEYLYGKSPFTRIAIGFRRPRIRGLGVDVAGEVEAVGRLVNRFRVGDKVFGNLTQYGLGAFAEFVCAPAIAFALMPARLTFEEAATVPQAAVLALQGLRGRRRIAPRGRILINGAGGNVGPFAVQIAKHFGAEVTGVDRTEKLEMVRLAGADHVIDFTQEDFWRNGRRYDLILDVVARRSMLDYRPSLRSGGAYVMLGASTARILQGALLGPVISTIGSQKMAVMWWWKPFAPGDVALLSDLIESGVVTPVIDRRYPLIEVPDALAYLERGQARGKVVITI
ncbi:MAG TPA: NAD(P)-dependent alcohol dehydrogenase [Candidatus Dormibacteraeota bacterium]|jgi:NADPH:quinone reductase-like Zn-dependent oxidoreductase|nr:NAD(P)-dependent alcohol dehydrogenase [Candidatus Dormibacteraeota bacterium]